MLSLFRIALMFSLTYISGTTIHAWGAVTPGMHDIGKLISCIKTARPAHQRWKTTKVLIIDEGTTINIDIAVIILTDRSRVVSMVDGYLFDTLSKLATELRKKTGRPFGGIQVRLHIPSKIRLFS